MQNEQRLRFITRAVICQMSRMKKERGVRGAEVEVRKEGRVYNSRHVERGHEGLSDSEKVEGPWNLVPAGLTDD